MSIHDAIQRDLESNGFLTRWIVVAEVVTPSDHRQLHVQAGNGSGDAPPTWDILGMLDHAGMMVRYSDDDDDDTDED